MKSTTVFALVASLMPVAMAAPYNLAERDAEADVKYQVDYVTDVEVATVYTQVTQYWTGEPAAETPSPATTSSTSAAQTSVPAHNRHHEGEGRGRRSTVEYTIQQTSTSEPAPVVTTTIAPVPPPTTMVTIISSSSSTPPPPPPPPAETTTSSQEPSTTTSEAYTPPASTVQPQWVNDHWEPAQPIKSGLAPGPSDYAAGPTFDKSQYASGWDAFKSDALKSASLAITNAWRAKWGVSAVEWDDDQASQAQTQVNTCVWGHTRVFQNLAGGTSPQSAIDLINSWGNEAVNWQTSARDGSDGIGHFGSDGEWVKGEVGHFTQLVWKDTKKMGCAVNNCGTSSAPNWIFVCNYDTGNMGNSATAKWTDSQGRVGSYAEQVASTPVY